MDFVESRAAAHRSLFELWSRQTLVRLQLAVRRSFCGSIQMVRAARIRPAGNCGACSDSAVRIPYGATSRREFLGQRHRVRRGRLFDVVHLFAAAGNVYDCFLRARAGDFVQRLAERKNAKAIAATSAFLDLGRNPHRIRPRPDRPGDVCRRRNSERPDSPPAEDFGAAGKDNLDVYRCCSGHAGHAERLASLYNRDSVRGTNAEFTKRFRKCSP